MSTIYDTHANAFSNVASFVILKGTDLKAKISVKYPKDGAGRLTAYVHWLGVTMVKGTASGYGYDKLSAALFASLSNFPSDTVLEGDFKAFYNAIASGSNNGTWREQLQKAGFTAIQAL